MEQIIHGALEACEARHGRDESIKQMKWDGLYHAVDGVTRKLKKITTFGRRSSLTSMPPSAPVRKASMERRRSALATTQSDSSSSLQSAKNSLDGDSDFEDDYGADFLNPKKASSLRLPRRHSLMDTLGDTTDAYIIQARSA